MFSGFEGIPIYAFHQKPLYTCCLDLRAASTLRAAWARTAGPRVHAAGRSSQAQAAPKHEAGGMLKIMVMELYD